ncbi:LuxR C-terminal-related transcriptional regulator [Nonomuraea ferruginea]
MAGVFDTICHILDDRRSGAHEDEGQDEVLRALDDGLTDDRAAARLHLSKRTFARRVAGVMERLNATSRFQAGAEAVRRGWI